MTETLAVDTHLSTALAQWGLTVDDVPGVAEAWAARFEALGEPLPESPTVALRRLSPDTEEWQRWTDLTISEVFPHSDGSLSIDVEGDASYETGARDYDHASVTLTSDAAHEFLVARENEPRRRELGQLAHERERFEEGELPVWGLLAKDFYPGAVRQAAAAFDRARRPLDDINRTVTNVTRMLNALETATPLPADAKNEFVPVQTYAVGVKPWSKPTKLDRWGGDPRVVKFDEVNDVAKELAVSEPEARRLQAALDQAKMLPEGELKEFLIGVRPERFFETTEGTGRKKRPVKRSYTPTSDLVSEHRRATDKHERVAERRDALLANLRRIEREAPSQTQAAAAEYEEAKNALHQAWAAGWAGDPEKLPVYRNPARDAF